MDFSDQTGQGLSLAFLFEDLFDQRHHFFPDFSQGFRRICGFDGMDQRCRMTLLCGHPVPF